jgi:hypothetical protein
MKRDYIEFQDRSEPLTYLITFRCYGTWLHGDKRGSVDRRFLNRYEAPKLPECPLKESSGRAMKQPPYLLGPTERRVAKAVISEVCAHKGYAIRAVNVRSNHIHLVVCCGDSPEKAMNAFKAYITRRLHSVKMVGPDRKIWT